MRDKQCLQSLSIEPVKIRQLSGIHADSMPWKQVEK
jgi:hypothetical protein